MYSSALVSRIRSEFLEMPGLQLTLAQAARLWGLEQRACRDVIEALVASSFLRWTPRGTVVRTGGSFAPLDGPIGLLPGDAAIR